jgi:CBS domain-containing protein
VRTVQVVGPADSVLEAARVMRESDVGTVVVLGGGRRPVGILTDRDVMIRCVAEGLDPAATPVREVMTGPVSGVNESMPIEDALQHMAGLHTRRLIVVDAEGGLVGILALDDVLELLSEEVASIGRLLAHRAPRGAAS